MSWTRSARLEQDLRVTASRLRQIASPSELEQLPATLGSVFEDADQIQVDQAREMGLMTKSRLTTRARKIASALRRLDDGVYGLCAECGERIKPARLKALPEVETCIGCQDAIERWGRAQSTSQFWLDTAA